MVSFAPRKVPRRLHARTCSCGSLDSKDWEKGGDTVKALGGKGQGLMVEVKGQGGRREGTRREKSGRKGGDGWGTSMDGGKIAEREERGEWRRKEKEAKSKECSESGNLPLNTRVTLHARPVLTSPCD